jgi:hypothetical protein
VAIATRLGRHQPDHALIGQKLERVDEHID